MTAPLVILDTDFSSDVDDAGDLVACIALHKMGVINLIGIVVCSTNSEAPGAVSAVLTSFGLSVPIGCWNGAAIDPQGPGLWVPTLYADYARSVGLASTVESALSLYKRLLTASPNGSVEIVAVGFANCLAELLADSPALVAAKVADVSWAAGEYPTDAGEFNITNDQASAQAFVAGWPNRITYSGYNNGTNIITGGHLQTNFAQTDPTTKAYLLHWTSGAGRSAWGQMSVLWTAFKTSMFSTVRGNNVIVGDANTFTVSASGRDYYIRPTLTNAQYVNILNPLLSYPRSGGRTRWPDGAALVMFA